jgi:hypothetical protein
MDQYPDEIGKILQTFLSTTNTTQQQQQQSNLSKKVCINDQTDQYSRM